MPMKCSHQWLATLTNRHRRRATLVCIWLHFSRVHLLRLLVAYPYGGRPRRLLKDERSPWQIGGCRGLRFRCKKCQRVRNYRNENKPRFHSSRCYHSRQTRHVFSNLRIGFPIIFSRIFIIFRRRGMVGRAKHTTIYPTESSFWTWTAS